MKYISKSRLLILTALLSTLSFAEGSAQDKFVSSCLESTQLAVSQEIDLIQHLTQMEKPKRLALSNLKDLIQRPHPLDHQLRMKSFFTAYEAITQDKWPFPKKVIAQGNTYDPQQFHGMKIAIKKLQSIFTDPSQKIALLNQWVKNFILKKISNQPNKSEMIYFEYLTKNLAEKTLHEIEDVVGTENYNFILQNNISALTQEHENYMRSIDEYTNFNRIPKANLPYGYIPLDEMPKGLFNQLYIRLWNVAFFGTLVALFHSNAESATHIDPTKLNFIKWVFGGAFVVVIPELLRIIHNMVYPQYKSPFWESLAFHLEHSGIHALHILHKEYLKVVGFLRKRQISKASFTKELGNEFPKPSNDTLDFASSRDWQSSTSRGPNVQFHDWVDDGAPFNYDDLIGLSLIEANSKIKPLSKRELQSIFELSSQEELRLQQKWVSATENSQLRNELETKLEEIQLFQLVLGAFWLN